MLAAPTDIWREGKATAQLLLAARELAGGGVAGNQVPQVVLLDV